MPPVQCPRCGRIYEEQPAICRGCGMGADGTIHNVLPEPPSKNPAVRAWKSAPRWAQLLAVLLVLVALMALFPPGSVEPNCQVNAFGGQCNFTNASVVPAKGCVRVSIVRKTDGAEASTSPICSGFLWPRSTTTVPLGAFDRNLLEHCGGDLSTCEMRIR